VQKLNPDVNFFRDQPLQEANTAPEHSRNEDCMSPGSGEDGNERDWVRTVSLGGINISLDPRKFRPIFLFFKPQSGRKPR
jgi:hypothetical protein